MKRKKSVKIKLLALLIITAMLIPMTFACGEKAENDDASSKATEAAGENSTTTAAPTNPPTTPEPTDPPTTEEPTEPFVADPGMSYWEQIEAELAFYGLSGGVRVFSGADEAALMKGFGAGNSKKAELDLSDENVPFSSAYRVTVEKDMDEYWSANYTRGFEKNIELEEEDLIVGVIWIRGVRLSETEQFFDDDPPQYQFAIKTPTDNWATEGDMSPSGVQLADEEWQKVFFTGRVMNEEPRSQNLQFQIFIGYGNQQLDVGGAVAYVFPSTLDNEKATWKLVS